MTAMPAGTCRNCSESVSYFARSCRQCGAPNQPNPVTTTIALLLLILLPLAALFGPRLVWNSAPQAPPGTASPATNTSTEPKAEPFEWIVQAMADCDAFAKQNSDTLYFLIVPVAPSATPAPGWRPGTIGNIGASAVLLGSADALLGLRNGSLELYREPLTFAVKDPASGTIYKWKPAVGVSELKSHEVNASSLTLGIQLGDGDIEWGPTLPVAKGTCYWTNPLVLPGKHGG